MKRPFHIAEAGVAAQHYAELHRRFQKEWPEMKPPEPNGQAIPKPVVALASSGALAGGLAFTTAKAPLSEEQAIWINAVLVAPEYRRQGVGRQLILAAEAAAVQLGILRLYALTDVPALYSSLNWSILSGHGANFIMLRELGAEVA